jgi:hypothetical protein
LRRALLVLNGLRQGVLLAPRLSAALIELREEFRTDNFGFAKIRTFGLRAIKIL